MFDFDGTLFRSPERPLWWTEKVWWDHPSSLDEPVVPAHPHTDWWNAEVVGRAFDALSNFDTLVFVCTGRPERIFHSRVHELLNQVGLEFPHVYLSPGGNVPQYKMDVISRLLHKHPTIRGVSIWEDRLEHLREYSDWVESNGRACYPHLVTVPAHEPACGPEAWESAKSIALRSKEGSWE